MYKDREREGERDWENERQRDRDTHAYSWPSASPILNTRALTHGIPIYIYKIIYNIQYTRSAAVKKHTHTHTRTMGITI